MDVARASPTPKVRTRSEVRERPELKRAFGDAARLLGARLRALREEREQTREVAAEKVGIHPIHLARIEYGQSNVTLATLVALARAYDVELEDLFRREAPK